jgi:hypothetical protein
MQRLPPPDLADRGHDLRLDQPAATPVVPGHASPDAEQQGISIIELGRRLGLTQTAWKMKHKVAQAMMERDAGKRLSGRVELDDAYLGGERYGDKRGQGAPGKTPFVVAAEITRERKPVCLKMRRVTSFCSRTVDFCQAEPRFGSSSRFDVTRRACLGCETVMVLAASVWRKP